MLDVTEPVADVSSDADPRRTVSFGEGVTVMSNLVIDEARRGVIIQIAANATPGPRPIFYRNPGTGAGPETGGFAILPNAFTVT